MISAGSEPARCPQSSGKNSLTAVELLHGGSPFRDSCFIRFEEWRTWERELRIEPEAFRYEVLPERTAGSMMSSLVIEKGLAVREEAYGVVSGR